MLGGEGWGCSIVKGAQYSEGCWGSRGGGGVYKLEDLVVELLHGISFHDLSIVYCLVT